MNETEVPSAAETRAELARRQAASPDALASVLAKLHEAGALNARGLGAERWAQLRPLLEVVGFPQFNPQH